MLEFKLCHLLDYLVRHIHIPLVAGMLLKWEDTEEKRILAKIGDNLPSFIFKKK